MKSIDIIIIEFRVIFFHFFGSLLENSRLKIREYQDDRDIITALTAKMYLSLVIPIKNNRKQNAK